MKKAAAKKKTAKQTPAKKSVAGMPPAERLPTLAEASRRIDERIESLADWRGEMLAAIRRLIHKADPEIVEECKWIKPTNPWGVPVWSHGGIVCTGETYKEVVKLTFARGASLPDPDRLFNASLDGGTRRAIDLREGEKLDGKAFQTLIRAAIAENLRLSSSKSKSPAKKSAPAKPAAKAKRPVKLLSGGNPQIAKGDGEAPVKAYLAAIPGWKRAVAERVDELIAETVPNVRKAVKWNSPFYGIEGQGWFLSFHVFTKYLKIVFFAGASLRPLPPVSSKDPKVKYFHIEESAEWDEAQFLDWVKQAAAMPGWDPGKPS